MCTQEFFIISIIIFGLCTVDLYLYMYRLQSMYTPSGKCALICAFHLILVGTMLAFHTQSICPIGFINWGAIVFALWFILTCVETCHYTAAACVSAEENTFTGSMTLPTTIQ